MTTPAAGGAADAAAGVTDDPQAQPTRGSAAGGQGQQGGGTPGQQQPAEQGGLYDKYLANLPRGVHGEATKAFQQWDADVTRRQQELQSRYAPYQSLVDSGADPQRLTAATEFLDWMQEDPGAALAQAAEAFGIDLAGLGSPDGQGMEQDQGQPNGEGAPAPGGDDIPPWFAQYQQQQQETQQLVQLLAQQTVAQHEGQQQEQLVDELESTLREQAEAAQVDLDDPHAADFLLAHLASTDDQLSAGDAVKQAIEKWQALTGAIRGQAAGGSVPPMLGAGGGLPTQQVDPATLSTADRRRLVAQRAAAAMQAGG